MNMEKNFYSYIFLGLSLVLYSIGCAQDIPDNRPVSIHQDFDKLLTKYIDFKVPLVDVSTLKHWISKEKVYLLDAREKEEYTTSHLKNARYIGYNNFKKSSIQDIPKDAKVVLYCTIGYRSGIITKKLQKLGFTNVYNLFGSIVEWKNQGGKVVNKKEEPTEKVHMYSKSWSKWLKDGKAVY